VGAQGAVAALDLVDRAPDHVALLGAERAGHLRGFEEVDAAAPLELDAEVVQDLFAVDLDLGLGLLAVQEDAAVPVLGQGALVGGVEVLGDGQQGLVGLG